MCDRTRVLFLFVWQYGGRKIRTHIHTNTAEKVSEKEEVECGLCVRFVRSHYHQPPTRNEEGVFDEYMAAYLAECAVCVPLFIGFLFSNTLCECRCFHTNHTHTRNAPNAMRMIQSNDMMHE